MWHCQCLEYFSKTKSTTEFFVIIFWNIQSSYYLEKLRAVVTVSWIVLRVLGFSAQQTFTFLKSTIEALSKMSFWCFMVTFKHIPHFFLEFLLINLSMYLFDFNVHTNVLAIQLIKFKPWDIVILKP